MMTTLDTSEIEAVNGGVIPVIVAGTLALGKCLAADFGLGLGLGMAVGAIWALAE
jgi:lactobin A/cerein 7B family class IIb bacteriocin